MRKFAPIASGEAPAVSSYSLKHTAEKFLAPQVFLPSQREGMSLRTELIRSVADETDGYGAGPGTIERHEFLCPCGDGTIVADHDNTLGFREHDVRVSCDKCRGEWRFVAGLSVREWHLEPVTTGIVG